LLAGGFIVNSAEDFKTIPDDNFDEYIRNSTKFTSWSKMQEETTWEYVARQIGF
jgi:hypothetical protein